MANIKVAVRVRPISEREIHLTGSEIVVHTEAKAISLTNLKVSSSKAGDSRERTRRYGFDYCFDSSDPNAERYASQSMIYETLGESILDVLFKGYNSCLVAYGQSASGKTYTMMGSKEDPGLTPRVCEGLFLRLADEENRNKNLDISVSYLEVYNERVRDLLKPSSNSIGLRVREHPRLGPYVQGLTHHAVPTLGSLISRVEEGTRARKTASTLQNPTSSRSHALLTLSLLPSANDLVRSVTDSAATPRNVSRRNDHFPRGSKLHLVDLAGSESAAACGGINRLKEGANINKSLVALGNVISALAERGSTGSGPGRRFIPYRDSALTWLLKDALGGNATTVMLATISPASGSYNETSHTLRFAQRAQSVVNRPVINEDPVSRVIRELRAEVARLKALLVEKNINPDLDCKSICPCQRDKEEEVKIQGHEEKKPEYEADYEVSIEVGDLSIPERRHSTSESLSSGKSLLGPARRFGSFEIVRESRSSLDLIEADNYNRAKISELLIDDEVDEPVFVDIPTLVAVLIKPENSNQVDSHQIEEIGSDGVPEDVTDAEYSGNVNNHVSSVNREDQNFQSNGTQIERVASLEISKTFEHPPKVPATSGVTTFPPRGRGKLRKHDSIDGDLPSKVTSNLQSLKKYGSIESLPAKKREIACTLQRSHTNLEKRNGTAEKVKKLNNIKEIEDQRSIKLNNTWRNLGAWANRDFQRKGSNDSDKSLKDSPTPTRAKNQARKQSVDGLKRKTSKDSSSSSSKDELLPSGGQGRDRSSRKGSLEHPEQLAARTHTPIQRARRAEIVAAVTERLYSSKKLSEDNNTTLPGTTATTPASEVRSPESSDVKLASATRMRLQEISRKMLAKRRRICVDTQTENHQTIRVRDVASITEEPNIIQVDASILTDRHEDYETLPPVDSPVTRVKEMSTLTDNDLQEPVIRCKDAGNVTDDYYEDYGVINSPRNDSGIMSDDTQNYAESNLSSTEVSDVCLIGGRRSVELVENSTNTRMPAGLPNSGSQTKREDLLDTRCSNCVPRCCGAIGHCHGNDVLDHTNNSQACHHPERNVISISLPDMVNITIETSNGLESKIKVFDGNEPVDERAVSLQDNVAQTDPKDALEIGTSTDDILGQVCFHDFSGSVKPMITQPDGKTFRIENIFREPRGVMRNTPKIEIVGNSSNDVLPTNSLVVTNSVGTSIIPETRENATGMESDRCYSSRSLLGPRRSFVSDALMTWPSRWRSYGPNVMRKNPAYSMLLENGQSWSDVSMETLKGRYDDAGYLKEKGLSPFVSDKKFLNSDKIRSREDPLSKVKLNEGFLKRGNEDVPMGGSKAPSIISMLDNKNDWELETNFSDDSLDPTEDGAKHDNGNCQLVEKTSLESLKVVNCRSEKACPPDLVAHTKNDKSDPSISIGDSAGFEDFDDDSHQLEIPKTKIDTALNLVTPISDFKTLILGDPCYTMNRTEDLDFTESSNQSSSSTLVDDENYCYASVDVIEDMEQCLVNGGCSIAPKSIIKKTSNGATNSRDSSKSQTSCGSKNSESEYVSTKKVRFSIPEVIELTSSDSEVCGNLTSDDEIAEQSPKSILEEYLGEAVVLIRNMNSMNEYMSAACASDKCRIKSRNHRREKGKSVNYIQYEGRRINLDDETDKDAKSDDEDLDFNVESYDNCLKSMDRLEECLARVKRHDEILRDNYGIGKDGSTGAKLDLAKSSIDSNDTNKNLVDKEKPGESVIMKNWRTKSVLKTDETNKGENNNLKPHEEEDKEAGSDAVQVFENLKKLRTRRFSRFSDLRKSNPITYSQLRGRYGLQASDERTDKMEDVPAVTKTEISKDDGPNVDDANSLQTPDCYLTLPKMTRIENGNSSVGIKSCISRPRFSLSKYDSSDESSSSNEALATFMESIDNVARSTDKFKYSGSPRAKFLQLLSERRRIVENTRSTGVS